MNTYTTHVEEVRAERSTRERIASLLGRYPKVSEKHRREILAFLKEGRHLDIGLLTTNDQVRPKLDAFLEDHRRHFRVEPFEVVRMLAVVAATIMVFWLLWEILSPVPL